MRDLLYSIKFYFAIVAFMPVTMAVALFKRGKILNALFIVSLNTYSLAFIFYLMAFHGIVISILYVAIIMWIYIANMIRSKAKTLNNDFMDKADIERITTQISLKDKLVMRKVGIFEMIKVIWDHSEELAKVP